MIVAIGLGKGLTNRQICQEMFLAEKTVKTLTSSVLRKLGVERRTQAAVLITRALNTSENHPYRSSPFPDLIAEVTAALLDCISESGTVLPTDEERARDARRLADALIKIRTVGGDPVRCRYPGTPLTALPGPGPRSVGEVPVSAV